MKQMCGRGKFFMSPGSSPNGKLRKFDDSRLFFYEGGPYGPPYGPPFSSTDFGFTSATRPPFSASGEKHFSISKYKRLITNKNTSLNSSCQLICNKLIF